MKLEIDRPARAPDQRLTILVRPVNGARIACCAIVCNG
jgi:hypothetical protein